MSSFTDEIPQFSPYIQQQPISEMATVGMRREQEFQEGIKTAQNYYDSLLQLPIAKQGVQDYVKQKVGQLNQAVGQSISGDFSDRRLLNQIGGLASQISNDPIVQNGVQSTARIQSGMAKQKADQERALKDGKNPTNNINDFNDKVTSYLSDGRIDTPFSEDYTPYVDVIDRALKLFKEQNPGQTLDADAFYYDSNEMDASGNPVLKVNPVYFKGVDPSRIQATLNLVYSQPDVQAQLSVDGRQTYKGMDANSMGKYMADNTNASLTNIEEAIKNLQVKQATDPSADGGQITAQIEALKKQADGLKKSFASSAADLNSGNIEGLKTKLVRDRITSNFINAYAFKTMEKSPLFDADMEAKRFKQQLEAFEWTKYKDTFDMNMSEKEYNLKRVKAEEEAKKEGALVASVNTLPVDQAQGKLGPVTAEQDVANAQTTYTQSRRALAAKVAELTSPSLGGTKIAPPYIKDPITQEYRWNNLAYKTEGEANGAAKGIYDQLNDQFNKGELKGELLQAYNESSQNWYTLQDRKRVITEVETLLKPQIEELKKKVGDTDLAAAYLVDKQLPGWETEEKNLKAKYGEGWRLNMGLTSAPTGGTGSITSLRLPKRLNEYIGAVKSLDAESVSVLDKRNLEYKKRQTTSTSKSVTFDISKPEKYKTILDKVAGALKVESQLGGSASSAADSFLSEMKEKDDAFSSLNAYYDRFTKKGIIEGWKGDKVYQVEMVPERLFESFPELRVNDEFINRYQSRLNIAQSGAYGASTDVDGRGRSGEPYLIQNPNYIVQYHVVGNGPYNIQYWITDKKNSTGPSIINGETYLESAVNEDGILKVVDRDLSDPNFIEKLVQRRKLSSK